MIGWKAWYAGGRVFSSDTHEWSEIPDDGVLVVMVYLSDDTRRICQGDDWYFDVDGVIAHNSDPREENERRYPDSHFKRGRWVSDDEYLHVAAEAMAE